MRAGVINIMSPLKVVAIVGHKKSGKTRLAVMLIDSLKKMGYRVASAKHVHHAEFSVDMPGKDSWLHGQAGACPNIIISPNELAVIWKGRTVKSILDLIKIASDADFLVLEGFYSLLKKYKEVVKVILVKNEEEIKEFNNEGIIVTFKDINCQGVIKLPEQFPQLLKKVLEEVT